MMKKFREKKRITIYNIDLYNKSSLRNNCLITCTCHLHPMQKSKHLKKGEGKGLKFPSSSVRSN